MIKNKLKIFIIFLLFIFSNRGCAYSFEMAQANEIKNEVKEETSNNFIQTNNNLGEESNKTYLNPSRPEMHIKSIGEIIESKKKKEIQNNIKQEEKEEPDIQIFCSEMEYFEDRNELEARGNVRIITPEGSRASSDKAVYNREDNTIKLINNVILYKGNSTIAGDYMLVDLNEENALIDEPSTRISSMVINAEEGYAYSDRLENLNGNIEFNDRMELEFKSDGFTRYNRAINDSRMVDFSLKQKRSKPYSFKTKEIVIRPQKDFDSMIFKDVDVYYKNKKILNVPSFEMFSDKEMSYTNVNFPPEFGSIKGFGTYFGLGYTFKLPKAYTLRVTPALTYAESDFGVGIIGQLKSDKLRLDAGWSSSMDDIIVDGDIKLTDKINLGLARHVYKDEWFNGGNRAGYIGELAYNDNFLVPDLGNAVFRHKLTAGYMTDYRLRHQESRDIKDGFRFRYQTELKKELANISSKEQDMYLKLSAIGQTMTTLYTQGNLFALFRVGPEIESRVKRWNSSITYTMGGKHGESPYLFDEYRYGRQTINFDESIILNRFLSLGYRGTLTPLKDNNADEILTENRFYAVAGPEDIKIAFSYDAKRKNMSFDFLFLIGSDNLNLRYDKLRVENPDKLGAQRKKNRDKSFYKIKVPEDI